MESSHGIIPERLIDLGMRKTALAYILSQPWPTDFKLQVWAGWRAETQASYEQGEENLLTASGWR